MPWTGTLKSIQEWLSDILDSLGGPGSTGVQGPVADGSAYGSNKPVVTGGVDGSGLVQTHKVDGTGRYEAVGAADEGAAMTGAPVMVAMEVGGLVRALRGITGPGDAAGIATTFQQVLSLGRLYNGVSMDLVRNNTVQNLFNGTLTASTNFDFTNFNGRGLMLILNITAVSGGSPTLDLKVQVGDGAGAFYDLTDTSTPTPAVVAFDQKTATGSDTMMIGPGVVQKAPGINRKYGLHPPRLLRIAATVGGTTPSFTMRLDAHLTY